MKHFKKKMCFFVGGLSETRCIWGGGCKKQAVPRGARGVGLMHMFRIRSFSVLFSQEAPVLPVLPVHAQLHDNVHVAVHVRAADPEPGEGHPGDTDPALHPHPDGVRLRDPARLLHQPPSPQ